MLGLSAMSKMILARLDLPAEIFVERCIASNSVRSFGLRSITIEVEKPLAMVNLQLKFR